MVFVFASCQKDEKKSQQNNETTTENVVDTNNDKNNESVQTTNENNNDSNTTKVNENVKPEDVKTSIIGTWTYDETVTPQNFYGEHYNEKITKNNIKMRTTYIYKNDGSFETGVSIVNRDIVEKEYKSLMVDNARKVAESQGKYLATKDVEHFEKSAQQVLDNLCKKEKGSYRIDSDRITYKIGDITSTETFTLTEEKLTVQGVKDNAYSMTLTKA